MSEKKSDVFALVYESGRAETFMGSGMSNAPLSDYWSVLDRIATAFNSGGMSSDYPKTLLRNGEPVEGRPVDLAVRYQGDLVRERDAALKRTREKHAPVWLKVDASHD